MGLTTDTPPKPTATLLSVPIAPSPTNKEAVLKFLTQLREDVEQGKCPLTDIIVIGVEDTEFTTRTSCHVANAMPAISVIGHLHAMATELSLETKNAG